MGLLVKYAPDVGTALRSFIRYQHLHVQGAAVRSGGGRQLGDADAGRSTEPGIEAIDHIGDAALATLYNIMHELCGPDWRPTEVWFAHRRPADVGPFRRFFRVPLRFDAEQYALLFPAGFLKRRLPGIDDEVARSAARADRVARGAATGDDFPAQVRSVLHTALMTGQSKADQVAALFGMHSRTLNRRLNAFGVGFQQLVEETRFEIARQMLEYSTNRDRPDLRVARLRRARCVHASVSPLERYDAGAMASSAKS